MASHFLLRALLSCASLLACPWGMGAGETLQLACRGLLLEKLIPHLGVCKQNILFL